jgi:membrane glycosyltransferase
MLRSMRLLGAALAAAGMILLPSSSETSRRIVVADAMVRRSPKEGPRRAAVRMSASDFLTLDAALAKRARKAAKRLARGH